MLLGGSGGVVGWCVVNGKLSCRIGQQIIEIKFYRHFSCLWHVSETSCVIPGEPNWMVRRRM